MAKYIERLKDKIKIKKLILISQLELGFSL